MRILFVGDVVGEPGCRMVKRALPRLSSAQAADLVVVNAENAARGAGLTPKIAEELLAAGADVLTSGNHVWNRQEIVRCLESNPRVLRPANYPDPAPGGGVCRLQARDGTPVAVINILGRLFMGEVDDPFRTADAILDELGDAPRATLIDFHAEATSEKMAFAWHLDGRVSAIVGTHTHVPTADERVLPRGTAYITDVGMTGPYDSVIGVEKSQALERFLTQRPVRFSPATQDVRLGGAWIDVCPRTGRAESIRRLMVGEEELEELG